jgi:hypothetical protein
MPIAQPKHGVRAGTNGHDLTLYTSLAATYGCTSGTIP